MNRPTDPRLKVRPRVWPLLLVALASIAGGCAYYYSERRIIREKKYEMLRTIAEMKVGAVQNWREERLADVSSLAAEPIILSAIPARGEVGENGRNAALRLFLAAERDAIRCDAVRVLDSTGSILATSDSLKEAISPEEAGLLWEVIEHGRPAMTDLYQDAPGERAHVEVMAPVWGSGRRIAALVELKVLAEQGLFPILRSWPAPNRSAEALLVRREGDEVLFLNDLRNRGGSALSFRLPVSRTDLPAVRAALGEEGAFEGEDYRGMPILADLRRVPGTSWFMIVKMDQDEVLAEARYRALATIAVVGLLILLATAGTAYIGKTGQAQLYRRLLHEERIRMESELRFRTLVETLNCGIFTASWEGRFTFVNAVIARMGGSDGPEEFMQAAPPLLCAEPADRELVKRALQDAGRFRGEVRSRHRDGSEFWVDLSAVLVRDAAGRPSEIFGSAIDVTERMRTEAILRETRDYLDSLINYANAPIIVWDDKLKVTKFNRAFEVLSGRDASEVLGREVDLLFPEGKRKQYLGYLDQASAGQRWETVEIEILHTDGGIRTLLWNSATVYAPDGRTAVATIAQGHDITGRIHAEMAIKRSLQEKEVLLKEIHHRVKNNLQIVASLLDLQAEKAANPAALEVFQDSRARIRVMAMVHEQLYQSADLAHISLKDYLEALVRYLAGVYGRPDLPVDLVCRIEEVSMGIDEAILCGLVGNELIANAFKHAFQDRAASASRPLVRVEAELQGEELNLRVTDNGSGLPASLEIHNPASLGLNLVGLMVRQLGGSLEVVPAQGAAFRIRFNLKSGEREARA